ncbi:hypothetical protein JCM17823_10940 [Halorubrum gandharaense]
MTAGAGEYSIDVENSIDTPEQQVEIEGNSYTISSIARVVAPDDIVIEHSGPSGEQYDVYLYDSAGDIRQEQFNQEEGDPPVEFSTDDETPGTFVAALEDDNNAIAAIHPVVIAAYDVSLDGVPDEMTAGEEVSVTAELSSIEERPIEEVQLVVWNGNSEDELSMTDEGDGTYTATYDEFEEGDYELYVAVRGEDEVEVKDELEILGLSDSSSLTVNEADNGGNGGSGGGGGGGGGGGAGAGDGETTTPTETETPTETGTPTTTPTETETPTETVESTESETPTETETGTESGPITPATEDPDDRSDDDAPLYAVQGLFAVVLLLAGGRRLRRR